MNTKSIFGIILTLVGLIGLVYGGIDFTKGGVSQASFVYLFWARFFLHRCQPDTQHESLNGTKRIG